MAEPMPESLPSGVPLYWVDAFADRVFGGNPAAVVPLGAWLPDATLQAIAAENGLPATAYIVRESECYALRWFTPRVELDLCGHATLASAFVVLTQLAPGTERVRFTSRSGTLDVARSGDRIVLDLPARPAVPVATPDTLAAALGRAPAATLDAGVYVAVFDHEDDVRSMRPDLARVAALDRRGVVVTAAGRDCDFVSRFFAPKVGVPEDPVTGSAHCSLVPYWAQRLGKRSLHARQVSARGGELWCDDRGARVGLAGRAVLYLTGTIRL